ncbi:MAG TPA: PIN domain-containing protein [Thermodesulfovibrionales bacterium]|nr:PIN domain-containing protein [Thermodesulfovibrionales bacterium]
MAKIKLLIDTDIFIDYFNHGSFEEILENKWFNIYYSVVTKKELLAKRGMKDSEKRAVLYTLGKHNIVRLTADIAERYSTLLIEHPGIAKEDALIAATALHKRLPLLTRNWKHYRRIKGLALFGSRMKPPR